MILRTFISCYDMYSPTTGADAAGHQGGLVYTDSGKKLLFIPLPRKTSFSVELQ